MERWTWWNEERFLAWSMDRCNDAFSTSQQANNFTAPTDEFSCGWAAVGDCQGVTGFRYWVLGIWPIQSAEMGTDSAKVSCSQKHFCWKVDRVILMLWAVSDHLCGGQIAS